MKIKTLHDPLPMPLRQFDWCAYDDETYDGPGSPIGNGATEQLAIEDLLESMELKGYEHHAKNC